MNYKDYFAKFEKNFEYIKAKKDLRFKSRLARAVVYARMAKGWSQSELARLVETKQANISHIESSLANPTLDLIRRLCDVLDIELEFSNPIIIPVETLSKQKIKTTTFNVAEELIRVDVQADNVFCGIFETKTESLYDEGVLN